MESQNVPYNDVQESRAVPKNHGLEDEEVDAVEEDKQGEEDEE